ncbi:MAG: hypothetical protein ACW99A_18610 [Candidatus Kariarchaeaceae archaeon]|jgi:hypothetical protein
MASSSGTIDIFDYIPSAPVFITESIPDASGGTNIELWSGSGVALTNFASGCAQIGDTNFWTWATSNIPTMSSIQEQYHWRITSVSGTDTAQGDFILRSIEAKDGIMPSIADINTYVRTA